MPTCAVAEFTFNTKSWSKIVKANLAKVALECKGKESVGRRIASMMKAISVRQPASSTGDFFGLGRAKAIVSHPS